MKKTKIEEFEELARNMVGDGKAPNVFFVSLNGRIQTITENFQLAYSEWKRLPRNVETALEDRQWGIICDNSPDEEKSNKLTFYDDSASFLKLNPKYE